MTDRELIIAAAEKVMSWRVFRTQEEFGEYFMAGGSLCIPYISPKKGDVFYRRCNEYLERWNPLENIADAWMLVEKIGATDVCIEKSGDSWTVDFPWGRGMAQTVTLAITIAALRSAEALRSKECATRKSI